MKLPHFRLAWLMAFVAIAALNFGAIRAVTDYRRPISDSLVVGALPMGNFLAFGLLIAHRRRRSRRFLLGFEFFGLTALVLYIAMAILFTDELGQTYLELASKPVRATIARTGWTNPRLVIAYVILSVWATLPQVAFALLGGFLFREAR